MFGQLFFLKNENSNYSSIISKNFESRFQDFSKEFSDGIEALIQVAKKDKEHDARVLILIYFNIYFDTYEFILCEFCSDKSKSFFKF